MENRQRSANDFQVIVTADGSPSLSVADELGYAEKMHHAAGAMSETLYIYGTAIQGLFERQWPIRVMSLGLGLGYNEILLAAFAVQAGTEPLSASLYTFETEPVLTEAFRNWILGVPGDFESLYDNIVGRAEAEIGVPRSAIRNWLRHAQDETWHIRGSFPEHATGVSSMNCVLYDAFSNKMCKNLWDESFLVETMTRLTAENCIFATYAATGSLNRALRTLGFSKMKRPGFAGKRESTFAVRSLAEREEKC